ncbi:hypothetical protein JZ751_006862, partial [Albula glossodonta]
LKVVGRPGKCDKMKHILSTVLVGFVLGLIIVMTVFGNVVVCLAVGASRKLRNGSAAGPVGAPILRNHGADGVDRYFAVTAPLRYPLLVTPVRVAVAMVLIWTVSLMVSFLPIQMGWNTLDGIVQNFGKDDDEKSCDFEWNPRYVLVDGFATFYLPLLVMCVTYYRIFRIAREQARRINSRPSVSLAAAAREHKATVTLAAVLGAFIICWFPYFTFFTSMGLRKVTKYNKTAYSVVLWLGYANSTLNPILYATLNRDFRAAFGQLLCGKKVCPAPPPNLSAPPPTEFVLLCAHTTGCREESPVETGLAFQQRNGSTLTVATGNTEDR